MPELKEIPGINYNHLPGTMIRKLATMKIADYIQLCGGPPPKDIENGVLLECIMNYLDAQYVERQNEKA